MDRKNGVAPLIFLIIQVAAALVGSPLIGATTGRGINEDLRLLALIVAALLPLLCGVGLWLFGSFLKLTGDNIGSYGQWAMELGVQLGAFLLLVSVPLALLGRWLVRRSDV